MIGRLISGRYLIEQQVGTGGMAVVYRARDTKKNETVALKILRPEFQTDEEFVQRFSREAQAAAKVSHQNIVNMLDVGIDGDMRYIVMEYVDGPTLKDVLRSEGPRQERRLVELALRMLAAIDHAHRNGIVHRDIKPQNILLDAKGNVKIADFGIARLKTSTQEEATAIGSVHYISPEQARGEQADEQSDLYSAGVVLYELRTGQVPFDGEKSFDIVMKHVGENPRSMRQIDPEISRALDEVIMRALNKDKRLRYRSAADMAKDLRRVLTHPQGGFVRYPKLSEDARQQDEVDPEKALQRRRKLRKLRKKLFYILGTVAIFALLAVLFMSIRYLVISVAMPNMIGVAEKEAVQAVEALGLEVETVSSYSEEIPAGAIMAQSRKAGERVRKESGVTLTRSLGSQWYQLEDMTGRPFDEAMEALERDGVATVEREYVMSEMPRDTVVSQSVESGWVSRDTPLTLYVSGQSVAVPVLTGLTTEAAKAVIEAEGLKVGLVTEGGAADAREGVVVGQSVEAGERVLIGTSLDLTYCAHQEERFAPLSSLTVNVPLNGLDVKLELTTPSGEVVTAYEGKPDEGLLRVALTSAEKGTHKVDIYEHGILFESLEIEFE